MAFSHSDKDSCCPIAIINNLHMWLVFLIPCTNYGHFSENVGKDMGKNEWMLNSIYSQWVDEPFKFTHESNFMTNKIKHCDTGLGVEIAIYF